jgi:hypothetical protein
MATDISTNINDYTDQDLLNILNLDENSSEYEITLAANTLIHSMEKDNKQDLVTFFGQVKDHLLDGIATDYEDTGNIQTDELTSLGNIASNEFLPQKDSTQTDKYTIRKQKVEFFEQDGHTPMLRQRLGVQQTHNLNVAQGEMNPILRTTTKRLANVDSQYRPSIYPYDDNNPNATASATNFTMNLSETLTNVISTTLYSIQIPYAWYIFDQNLGNTCFWIQDSSGNDLRINIPSGNYASPSDLMDAINDTIAAKCTPSLPCDLCNIGIDASNIVFGYDDISNKVFVENNLGSDVNLIFFSDESSTTCVKRYTCQGTTNQEIGINETFGWLLGFRPDVSELDESGIFQIALNGSSIIQADAVIDIYGPKYFLLVLDDYNQNHLNKGLINIVDTSTKLDIPGYYHKANSINTTTGQTSNCELDDNLVQITEGFPRQLTKAQIHTINEIIKDRADNSNRGYGPNPSDVFALIPINLQNSTLKNNLIEFGDNLQYNSREYFGPVDIERIRVKLVDDKGNTVNLHGADWSFSFIVEQLYQY